MQDYTREYNCHRIFDERYARCPKILFKTKTVFAIFQWII